MGFYPLPNPHRNPTEPQEMIVPFTLTQAAKEARISKSTLSVAIQKGRLSAVHRPDGSYEIEPVELFRVYPPKVGTMGVQEGVRSVAEPKPNPAEPIGQNTGLLHKELEKMEALLQREREASQREREAVQREQERVADLKKRLDQATEERRLAEERNHALMLRLMPPPQPAPQPAPEPPAVVEELRQRLEEMEARNRALSAVVVPQIAQEGPSKARAPLDPAKAVRGFLGRLLGR